MVIWLSMGSAMPHLPIRLPLPGGYTFDNMTLRNSARANADEGLTVTGTLLVTGNSVLSHSTGNEDGLVIAAAVVQVDEGSAIDADRPWFLGRQKRMMRQAAR